MESIQKICNTLSYVLRGWPAVAFRDSRHNYIRPSLKPLVVHACAEQVITTYKLIGKILSLKGADESAKTYQKTHMTISVPGLFLCANGLKAVTTAY